MAADSNMGIHHGGFLASALDRHAISFQSGAITSTSGMIPLGNSTGINSAVPLGNSLGMNSTSGMMLTGSSSLRNNNPGITAAGNSSGSLLIDSVPGLKHDTGLAVEWSPEEQSKLEEGLVIYADEPSIMRYIKIAAMLPDKTVRDVALRCQWMTKEKSGKRRKPDDHYTGKKMKDRKEKLAASSSKTSLPPVALPNMPAYPLMMHFHMDHDRMHSEVPAVGSTTRKLLDENFQVFSRISANLATFKIQENINLLCRTRNNITAILNDMRDMPGIMSQMPPLPVSINEELANSILPSTSATLMCGSSRGIHLKQEPGYR